MSRQAFRRARRVFAWQITAACIVILAPWLYIASILIPLADRKVNGPVTTVIAVIIGLIWFWSGFGPLVYSMLWLGKRCGLVCPQCREPLIGERVLKTGTCPFCKIQVFD